MKPTIIKQKIFELRGERVMLDFDLAELYGVETRVLNQAVKRNRHRLPKDFMFQLKPREWAIISSQMVVGIIPKKESNSSQIVMSSKKHRGKAYLPYAFTEHGVTMAANLLKSEKAVKMSIAVVRAFITLKRIALQHKDLSMKIEEIRKELKHHVGRHDLDLKVIFQALEKLLHQKAKEKKWEERERIGFRSGEN